MLSGRPGQRLPEPTGPGSYQEGSLRVPLCNQHQKYHVWYGFGSLASSWHSDWTLWVFAVQALEKHIWGLGVDLAPAESGSRTMDMRDPCKVDGYRL